MREDTQLRFCLVELLHRLPYGWSRKLSSDQVQKAWPPTGDHDTSPDAMFRALALAGSGNRPEESYTTDERIERDLDGSFTWYTRQEDGDYVFHRKDSACPKCRGQMQVPKRQAFELPDVLKADAAPSAMAFTESWEPCDMHGHNREPE